MIGSLLVVGSLVVVEEVLVVVGSLLVIEEVLVVVGGSLLVVGRVWLVVELVVEGSVVFGIKSQWEWILNSPSG